MTCFLKQKKPIDLQKELKPGDLFHLVSWVNPHTNKAWSRHSNVPWVRNNIF